MLYACVLAVMARNGFPTDVRQASFWPFLSDKPVGEDGYYMLTVAWNLATDWRFEYNGDILTTAIQPLTVVLYAMLAKLALVLGGQRQFCSRRACNTIAVTFR